MEKVLLERRDVLENGTIKRKVKITKKIIEANPTLSLTKGWEDQEPEEGGVDEPCPPATSTYYWIKVAGECVKVPV